MSSFLFSFIVTATLGLQHEQEEEGEGNRRHYQQVTTRVLANAAMTTTNSDDDDMDDDAFDSRETNMFATVLSYVFLFGLIFGLSATVEIKNLKKQLQNKFAIFTGVTMQFVIMPALGFVAVKALEGQPGWTKEMGIALLVVTSSPGGSYSNWWCSLFNADLALSVAMTTVSSLLSMAMLPLNLFLYTFLAYGTSEEDSVLEALDFETIFLALGIVLLAISSGLFAGYKFDNARFHVTANRVGSCSGVLLVLFSLLLSSGADGAKSFFWNQSWAFYVGVAFPCVVGLVLSSSIANALRLAKPETVAIAIECCYQNTGIATSVAIAMYEDKEVRAQAVAVPLFYGAVEALVILLYCIGAWKFGWTKAPANERLCVILAKTYEVQHDDDADDNGSAARDEAGSAASSTRFEDEASIITATTTNNHGASATGATVVLPFWRQWFGGLRRKTANLEVATVGPKGLNESLAHLKPENPASTPPALFLLPAAYRDRSFTVDTATSSNPPLMLDGPLAVRQDSDYTNDDDDVDNMLSYPQKAATVLEKTVETQESDESYENGRDSDDEEVQQLSAPQVD